MRGVVRLGFDEAGLGPTLGPLVVAGFATRRAGSGVSSASGPVDDLRAPLAEVIGEPGVRDGRLEIGDSKKIHTGARKLARVERSALATVGWVHGRIPGTVAELLSLVGVSGGAAGLEFDAPGDRRAPWWSMLDERLPICFEAGEIESLADRLRQVGGASGVEALWYRADVISVARVNRELGLEHARPGGGTKNTWATHAVLKLVHRALHELQPAEFVAWCDKAGGRKAYLGPLARAFADLASARPGGEPGIACLEEVRARSRYRLAGSKTPSELGFVMGGDRFDPRISWASILAKYLRELIMRAFNRCFALRIPGLRATAGYPEDARRFMSEVQARLGSDLGFERAVWVRSK